MGSIPALIPQSWMHNRIDSEALKIPMLSPTPSLQDSDVTGPGCSLGVGLFFSFFNPLQVILMCSSPGQERLLWSLESQHRGPSCLHKLFRSRKGRRRSNHAGLAGDGYPHTTPHLHLQSRINLQRAICLSQMQGLCPAPAGACHVPTH